MTDEQCGVDTENGGTCDNPPHPKHGDNGRCWIPSHQPDAGDAENPQGAPSGNTNSVEHALDMPTKRRLDIFREIGDPLLGMFEDYYVAYRAKAENKREAASLASAAVIRDQLESHLLKDGLTYTKQIGDPNELAAQGKDPEEAWTQMPKSQMLEAYQEARTEVRLGLKYEGVNDNNTGSGTTDGQSDYSDLWEGGEEEV